MELQLNTESINKKIKLDFKDSIYATGRRKKSIARVWLKRGSGFIYINGKKMIDYFKKTLKKEKLTTRDSRTVERKKYGHRKARRSFQFSKR